ncbi:MAG: prepilin-type N-terminal cleavage/methylation domain-containing protein [Oribacterium sp.]|nr:prepilin-type N-terminal cleavage/methylation domain-containing protein [Oribacterium sp.]
MKDDTKCGFTLAELMIVVVIVGILVAISIPIFAMQMKKSGQATDLANMRSAMAAAMADWYSENSPSGYSRYYDSEKGVMTDSIPAGYGKSSVESSEFAANLNASGIPNPGASRYIVVNIDESGAMTLSWGGNSSYINAVSPYKGKLLSTLHAMSNDDRMAADIATLTAIGNEILSKGWSLQQLKDTLGIKVQGNTVRVADYYQLKDDSGLESNGFVISSYSDFMNVLQSIGYDSGAGTSTTTYYGNQNNYYTNKNKVVHTNYANSLFYSDQLATNQFIDRDNHPFDKDATMRTIILQDVVQENGVIKSFKIYSKAMENQANMTVNDVKKFTITIGP